MASNPPTPGEAHSGSPRPGDPMTAPPDGRLTTGSNPRWTLSGIPADVGRIRYVRHQARAVLTLWALDYLTADVELLIGELASNAVRHAGTPFTVTLTSDRRTLRGEVSDANPLSVQPRLSTDTQAIDGRGLLLVDRIAQRWGTERHSQGKTVWFELAIARQ